MKFFKLFEHSLGKDKEKKRKKNPSLSDYENQFSNLHFHLSPFSRHRE